MTLLPRKRYGGGSALPTKLLPIELLEPDIYGRMAVIVCPIIKRGSIKSERSSLISVVTNESKSLSNTIVAHHENKGNDDDVENTSDYDVEKISTGLLDTMLQDQMKKDHHQDHVPIRSSKEKPKHNKVSS